MTLWFKELYEFDVFNEHRKSLMAYVFIELIVEMVLITIEPTVT